MKNPNYFHIESLSPLYEAVQGAGIFPDSKYFPDCIPKSKPAEILEAFETEKDQDEFDLRSFVERHFNPPQQPNTNYSSENRSINEHLNLLWDILTRQPDQQAGTLIALPKAYIVPGGRFREIYYWDSYFTMLGLKASDRWDIIQNMVDNFAYLINTIGFIPNGNRTYYLGRSQPPFFVCMVELLAEEKGEDIWLEYLPALQKEYNFWMAGSEELSPENTANKRTVLMNDGAVLNRYYDHFSTPRPEAYIEDVHIAKKSENSAEEVYRHIRAAAESGWDFSSRWFADGSNMETINTTDLLPVDLNCLLYHLEQNLGKGYRISGENHLSAFYESKATQRKKAILKYFWNENSGFFFDYDFIKEQHSGALTLAGLFPLFFNLASSGQAAQVAEMVANKFLFPGGVSTTLLQTGQQWDAPNGWAPLQWITIKGLSNYGQNNLAETIRQNWTNTVEMVYATTGKMMEKYNVMHPDKAAGGGEYPNQDGFGWTNGVYLGGRRQTVNGRR